VNNPTCPDLLLSAALIEAPDGPHVGRPLVAVLPDGMTLQEAVEHVDGCRRLALIAPTDIVLYVPRGALGQLPTPVSQRD
jgi:hypothetical protein